MQDLLRRKGLPSPSPCCPGSAASGLAGSIDGVLVGRAAGPMGTPPRNNASWASRPAKNSAQDSSVT
eukprot:12918088-Prorocentrum_lima.AAC.1